uniref:PHC3 n=1 Tax=Lates calcarifer TaxID=8187 RepID=A0A4W6D749_LATCA
MQIHLLCRMHYSSIFVSVCLGIQVFQQALHRQPNTAAQYLQQMYAAQQQHLMLQTAALQQQHSLSTAQLQSLAAVQQASIAAGRQSSSQNGTSSQQTGSTQATINLTTSPAAAQLISRAQSISSTPTSISQQAVLLGSPSSPTLTASQAQMYLRAQMVRLQTPGPFRDCHFLNCLFFDTFTS